MMSEKKLNHFESPNISTLQAVEIDRKTTIYIAMGADPEAAKNRYLVRNSNHKTKILS